ncbi:hypothetical protein JXB01_00920 [Candidatus Micrarchaeota archaeon]|nr:hypothetical protein [Candidatus Micrarchaeota archaeon]
MKKMKFISSIRDFTAEQWFRFSLGLQLLTIANFGLLVITAGDKLKLYTGLEYTKELLIAFVPVAFAFAWFAGYFMENIAKIHQAKEEAVLRRSPAWQEAYRRFDRIEEKLGKIERKL